MDYQKILLIIGIAAAGIALLIAILLLIRVWADNRRSKNMVALQILIPRKDSKEDKETEGEQFGTAKDYTKVIGVMSQFFISLRALGSPRWWNVYFLGQEYVTCEYAVIDGQVKFYLFVLRDSVDMIEKQIVSFYPEAVVNVTDAPNIFTPKNKIATSYRMLEKPYYLPLRTTDKLESEPMNNIITSLSKIPIGSGAGIQFVCRPVGNGWSKRSHQMAKDINQDKSNNSFWTYLNPFWWLWQLVLVMVHGDASGGGDSGMGGNMNITQVTQEKVKAIEDKAVQQAFDIIFRLVASAPTKTEADDQIENMRAAFDQYGMINTNQFISTYHHSDRKLVRDYIWRRFSRPFLQTFWRWLHTSEWRQILGANEMAALFHFPNAAYNKSTVIAWQDFKIVEAPHNVPQKGLILGLNKVRGVTKKICISRNDRRRHFYAIGKSGTGKSTLLEQMIRQDLQNGEGVCVVDPHGDLIEAVLPYVPRERADDVILFDPGDTDRPMGLNMLEAHGDDQKEFMAQEALAIFIKMYGEEIMGPRLQHYFRNGVLTLMADDDEGATILDIMRLFTDDNYAKTKIPKVTNPSVRAFWDKEMAKTGQREKEEMIPYFAAKFGPFATNAQIRNIVGQPKSGFDFRE
ncbi:MAG: hypothetical protein DSY80_08150, partial [Desulfocapsa sp.]